MTEVDLATLDRDLEDVMIGYYPGTFLEDQHYVDTSDSQDKVYRFFSLEKDILLGFLEDYKHMFEYEVLDSKTGEVIEVNKVNQETVGLVKVLQMIHSVN